MSYDYVLLKGKFEDDLVCINDKKVIYVLNYFTGESLSKSNCFLLSSASNIKMSLRVITPAAYKGVKK